MATTTTTYHEPTRNNLIGGVATTHATKIGYSTTATRYGNTKSATAPTSGAMIHVASPKRRDCTSATRTNNNTIVLNAIAIQNMEERCGPTSAATSTALSTRTSASSSTNHNHKNICIFAVERMGVAPW